MASVDYGSMFAFIIFAHELALIPIVLARPLWLGRKDAGELMTDGYASAVSGADTTNGERLNDDMRFLYGVAARDNGSVVQNIDALDNNLIAVAVGIFLVALFVGDKWFGLEPTLRFVALTLLGESAIIVVLGILSVYLVKTTAKELVRVDELMVDFSVYPAYAIERAILAFIESARSNRRIRFMKRAFITMATSLTFVAAIVCVAGRALGDGFSH